MEHGKEEDGVRMILVGEAEAEVVAKVELFGEVRSLSGRSVVMDSRVCWLSAETDGGEIEPWRVLEKMLWGADDCVLEIVVVVCMDSKGEKSNSKFM